MWFSVFNCYYHSARSDGATIELNAVGGFLIFFSLLNGAAILRQGRNEEGERGVFDFAVMRRGIPRWSPRLIYFLVFGSFLVFFFFWLSGVESFFTFLVQSKEKALYCFDSLKRQKHTHTHTQKQQQQQQRESRVFFFLKLQVLSFFPPMPTLCSLSL